MIIRLGTTTRTPAKPAEILLVQVLLTMSTSSLLYINAGNLTGLRGVIGVMNVAIQQHYTGIQEYTNTMIIHLEKKLTARSAKITTRGIIQQQIICKEW